MKFVGISIVYFEHNCTLFVIRAWLELAICPNIRNACSGGKSCYEFVSKYIIGYWISQSSNLRDTTHFVILSNNIDFSLFVCACMCVCIVNPSSADDDYTRNVIEYLY